MSKVWQANLQSGGMTWSHRLLESSLLRLLVFFWQKSDCERMNEDEQLAIYNGFYGSLVGEEKVRENEENEQRILLKKDPLHFPKTFKHEKTGKWACL